MSGLQVNITHKPTPEKSSASDKNSQLKKCFTTIVDRKQLNIDVPSLEFIIKHDLAINFTNMDPRLEKVLPNMLVVFISTWPGWERSNEYFSGNLPFKQWFERFRQYIIYKINYLIQNGFQRALNEIKQEKEKSKEKAVKHAEIQTDNAENVSRGFAPYTLEIGAPPKLLNTLIFTNSGDNVVLKMHQEKPWIEIDTKQLLNLPFVEVKFTSPLLVFTRTMATDYKRYLTHINDTISFAPHPFIEEVVRLNKGIKQLSYSNQFIQEFVKAYNAYIVESKMVSPNKAQAIAAVLDAFVNDAVDIGKTCDNYVPINTGVLFNIGGCRYIRNKKINSVSCKDGTPLKSQVGYCEFIIPMCRVDIYNFQACQDTGTEEISFIYLNKIRDKLKKPTMDEDERKHIKNSLPQITYGCTFCNLVCADAKDLMSHFKNDHKMEHPILCYDCRVQYPIMSLTANRWTHSCPKKQATNATH